MPGTSSPTPTSEDRFRTAARQQPHPLDDCIAYLKDYAAKKPEVAAMWIFGIGFVLGWKLKPW